MFDFFKKQQDPMDVVKRIGSQLTELMNIVNFTQNLPQGSYEIKVYLETVVFVTSVVLFKVSTFQKTDFKKFSDEFSNAFLTVAAESQAEYDYLWESLSKKRPAYDNLLDMYSQAPSVGTAYLLLRNFFENCTNEQIDSIRAMTASVEFIKIVKTIAKNTYE